MESEITVKAVKRQENRVGLMDSGGVWYSAFKPKPEAGEDQAAAWELLGKVDRGYKVKLWYEPNERGFKNIHGLEILGAEVDSNRVDTGGKVPGRYQKNEDFILWESIFKGFCQLLAGGVTPPADVVAMADTTYDHVKEKIK